MFDSSDVQSVFSGNIAEEWEKKSRYINSLNGNDNMMIPTIKKYITSTSKIVGSWLWNWKIVKSD